MGLFAFIAWKMKSSSYLEDLYQELSLSLLRELIRNPDIEIKNKMGYLTVAFYNQCRGLIRKQKAGNRGEKSYGVIPDEDLLISDEREDPLGQLIFHESVDACKSAIESLNKKCANAIYSHYLEDLTYQECSEKFGTSLANLRAQVHRGINDIRKNNLSLK
jgi:RNA polymerase sigma factor (sigma-70 family)